MSQQDPFKRLYLPFGDLLTDLERQGFRIGVEHHLHLYRLMQESEVFGQTDLDTLKETLCPLFATNPEEQLRFYAAFDWHFAQAKPPKLKAGAAANTKVTRSGPPPLPSQPTPKGPSSRSFWLMGIGILVFCGIMVFLYSEFLSPNSGSWPSHQADNISSAPIQNDTYIDQDTVPQQGSSGPSERMAASGPLILSPLKYINPDIRILEIPNPWWHEYEAFVNWWIVFCILGLVLLYEYFLFARKKAVLSQKALMEKGKAENLKIFRQVTTRVFEGFAATLNVLRKRVQTNRQLLDIPATVKATARMGGWLDLRFEHDSKPAEYLVLIERQTGKDLLTKLFGQLTQQLGNSGMHVEVFFIDPIQDTFTSPRFSEPFSLKKLAYHYGDHRLLVLGTHLDWVVKGNDLSTAGAALHQWMDPAFFSPTLSGSWSTTEQTISQHFAFFPFSQQGWSSYAYYLETGTQPLIEDWPTTGFDFAETKDAQADWRQLQAYLGRAGNEKDGYTLLDLFAGCCHYPRLEWRLTLLLAQAMDHPQKPMLAWENLSRLLILPWFRSGQIPEEVRTMALADPTFTRNGSKEIALKALQEALQDNFEPGSQTVPQLERELSWLVTNIQLTKNTQQKRKWQQRAGILRNSLEQGEQIYLSLKSASRIGWNPFTNSAALRNRLFTDGKSHRGLTPIARLVFGLVFLGLPLMMLDLEVRSCRPLHFVYMSNSYCPNTPAKEAAFRTHRAAFYHNTRPLEMENPPAHHNLSNALKVDPTYAPALINLFVRNYNRGLIQFHSLGIDGNYADALATWQENQAATEAIQTALTNGIANHQAALDNLRNHQPNKTSEMETLEQVITDFEDYTEQFNQMVLDNQHAIGLALFHTGDRQGANLIYTQLPEGYFTDLPTPNLQTFLN